MPNLNDFLAARRIRRLASSAQEISDLFLVVERDLADAKIGALSSDRRFATAYNAGLQLANIVLRAEGLQTAGVGHHHTTFLLLPVLFDRDVQMAADYLDACRSRRNTVDYDGVGVATENDVAELLAEAEALCQLVRDWIGRAHPELL